MELPSGKDRFFAPAEFEDLREATLNQIEKDFRLQGFEIAIPDRRQSYTEILGLLSEHLDKHKLIGSNQLQSLLYQLDISEQFIREEILSKPEDSHSKLLADAIVKRCFAKVIYRKKYS